MLDTLASDDLSLCIRSTRVLNSEGFKRRKDWVGMSISMTFRVKIWSVQSLEAVIVFGTYLHIWTVNGSLVNRHQVTSTEQRTWQRIISWAKPKLNIASCNQHWNNPPNQYPPIQTNLGGYAPAPSPFRYNCTGALGHTPFWAPVLGR